MTLKKVYDMAPTTSTVDIEDKLFYLSESPTTDEKLTLKQHRDYTNEGILIDNDGAGAESSLTKSVSQAFIAGAGTVTLGVNISGLTAVGTTPASDDYLQIYQTSTSDIKKISISNLVAAAAGGGDVTGPALSVDKTIPRFDGTTGKTIKTSGVTISDANVVTAAGGFIGALTGGVTGNVTGDVTGNVNGNVTGNLTGNVTGNVTGALTGNADTATALETPRDILGQTFDGTANITADITDLSDVYSTMTPVDGQILTYDTTNGWQAETFPGGTGTVQSVGISVTAGTGIAVSGTNPVTTTGTINLALGSIPNASLANSTMSIAGQSSTLGGVDTPISIQNLSDVDSASPSDNDVLQYNTATGEYIPTALGTGGTVTSVGFSNGLGLTFSGTNPVTGDNAGTEATFAVDVGIADDKIVQIDSASVAATDYAKFTANGLEGRSDSEVKTDLSLNNVENTALSTWTGSTNITTLGTIATGTWEGSTLAVDKGGTGETSYTEGQLLIGTSANVLAPATLSEGTGISITNASGAITITNTVTAGDPAGTAVAMAIALGG
jgi:hypothetical protein